MMKTLLKKITFLTVLIVCGSMQLNAQSFDFEADDSIGDWSGTFNSSASYDGSEDALEYIRTNANNQLELGGGVTIDATMASTSYFKITFKNLGGASQLRIKATAGVNENEMGFDITGVATTDYETKYYLLAGNSSWDDAAETILVQFRSNFTSGEGAIYIKEIAFVETVPIYDGPWDLSVDQSDWTANFNGNGTGFGYDAGLSAYKLVRDGNNSGIASTTVSIDAIAKPYLKLVYNNTSLAATLRVNAPENGSIQTALNQISGTAGAFITQYFDLSANTRWDTTTETSVDIQFRANYAAADSNDIFVKEIDFLTQAEYDLATLGVEDVDLKDDINIVLYPNPVQNTLQINALNSIDSIEIFNLLGQKVMEQKGSNAINVRSLSKGNYIVKIFQENETVSTKRFIKK